MQVQDEKGVASAVVHLEQVEVKPLDEKALLRKLDWHLIPWLTFLFVLSFLDRSSIGNARLYGLEDDLRITDKQYLIALTIFFIPYALFEMPSNLALKRLRPSRWLSFLMIMWGIIMMCHGFARTYSHLLALRFFLGLFESGMYPGIVFYLSSWYRRDELGVRVAVFASASTLAGAFGGLLAAAISNMNGIGGKPAWAWIFIIEGIVTVAAASISVWIIQDFPTDARFLADDERVYIISRMQADQQFSAAGEKFRASHVVECLKDKKTWIGLGMLMGAAAPVYAFTLFTPTIINQLGFQATAANLLTVPVYVFAFIVACLFGVVGDKYGQRGYIDIAMYSVGLVGYIILIVSRSPGLSYFAVYLAAAGINTTIPTTATWISTNTEGSYKRSAALGLIIGWGNLNGAVTSNVYRAIDKPWYTLGHAIILVYISIGLSSAIAMRMVLKSENAKRERGECSEVIRGEHRGIGDAEESGGRIVQKGDRVYKSIEEAKREKGDLWSGFRYAL